MAKLVSSLMPNYSKCLTVVPRRYFAKEIKGSWNTPPLCDARDMPQSKRKCHPKEGSCSADLSACPVVNSFECSEPDVRPPAHLACCCDHRLTKNPCEKPAKKPPQKAEKQPFKSMWEVGGMQKRCRTDNPRLDETHYTSSDKTTRVYTQTWNTCGPMIRKRKVCCLNEMCMLPPLQKRREQECPLTAKEQDSDMLKLDYNVLRKCLENVIENPNTRRINKCRKVVMPCCRKVTTITKCNRNRRESECVKESCPHPSFSECDHPCAKQEPGIECRCSHFPPQCDANRFLIRKKIFHLPPPLPTWPASERPK